MLSPEEKKTLLRSFPYIKLSYETVIHKKVHNYQLALAIPEGKKCFAWFTFHNDAPTCFVLEVDRTRITHIKIVNACFTTALCYGTILYGTLFYHKNAPFFAMEDVLFYKNNSMTNVEVSVKFNKLCHILAHDIQQVAYNRRFVVFGLPLILHANSSCDSSLKRVPYALSAIKYYTSNRSSSGCVLSMDEYMRVEPIVTPVERAPTKPIVIPAERAPTKPIVTPVEQHTKTEKKYEKVFICKPDIQNDVYHLYTTADEYVGVACIPTYKTSVMMNALFRTIKENDDLDALECSDDEAEFENPNANKFVHLDKSYKMVCTFHHKFKKWTPIKITV